MLRQNQVQKLQQSLLPQQIQLIKLLEIPTTELDERIRKELEENPALEEGTPENDEPDFEQRDDAPDEKTENDDLPEDKYDDENDENDIPTYKLTVNNRSRDDETSGYTAVSDTSFHDFLIGQIGLTDMTENEKRIAEYIIGNINADGYLLRTADDISDDILFQTNESIEAAKIAEIIGRIRQLDPAGTGASSLRECLALQLGRKKETPAVRLAAEIVQNCFDEMSKKQYEKIQKKTLCSPDELKLALAEIRKLNPKPGNAWAGNAMERNLSYIVPDFILEADGDDFSLSLNSRNMPELRITKEYGDMLQNYSAQAKTNREIKKAADFVRQKIDAANTFIEALRQRQVTLLTTMEAIVRYQKKYFQTGDEADLKPMIMKDIAAETGYDVSTISRVSNSKYVQTDFGFFPLKHFFSEKANADNGDEVSTRKIKSLLAHITDEEDKQKPYSDDELSAKLKEAGFNVARRTVAKYREQMGIAVARLRKEM